LISGSNFLINPRLTAKLVAKMPMAIIGTIFAT